jgi:pimeloyl-ACP methyl ester carboxylesterase
LPAGWDRRVVVMSANPPPWLRTLVGRYDPSVFEEPGREVRVRLVVPERSAWEVVLAEGAATIRSVDGRPQAVITADAETWAGIAAEPRTAISAYVDGRLSVRSNLHVGVGFLSATSGAGGTAPLRFRSIATRRASLSVVEAGEGPTVLAVHGLGATKGSFVTTIDALSSQFRTIAFDLPGFGDSSKPIGAGYDARFFATACIDLLDALELDRVHLIGNSLGGRVALEVALRYPDRVDRLALLAPALAWRRPRPWAPVLRLTRPELGLVQIAPRAIVDALVRQVIPGANQGWRAAGVDEFLRAYLTPAGRAAFYAAARHIYLDEPHGKDGFWPRLAKLQAEALFVWGRRDQLVPIGFARHVADAVPHATQLELDCGHVPQIESPALTNSAIARFFSRMPAGAVSAIPAPAKEIRMAGGEAA